METDKFTLQEADGVLNKMFLSGVNELFKVLSPKIEDGGVILCSRTCLGVITPDSWSFNKVGDNLIFKWAKDNNNWESFLPAAGIPLIMILSKKECITGFYTDACIMDDDGVTIMIYKVLQRLTSEAIEATQHISGEGVSNGQA